MSDEKLMAKYRCAQCKKEVKMEWEHRSNVFCCSDLMFLVGRKLEPVFWDGSEQQELFE